MAGRVCNSSLPSVSRPADRYSQVASRDADAAANGHQHFVASSSAAPGLAGHLVESVESVVDPNGDVVFKSPLGDRRGCAIAVETGACAFLVLQEDRTSVRLATRLHGSRMIVASATVVVNCRFA